MFNSLASLAQRHGKRTVILAAVLFVIAAQDGVATAAVLASQFAAIAAVGAFLLFG